MSTTGGLSSRNIVLSEVNGLIVALRTTQKFSNSARFQYEIPKMNESSLMLQLKELKNLVSSKNGWESIETMTILLPFFTVIRSEEITGPITGIALNSIEKFVQHPCISIKTVGAKVIMQEIIDALKQVQFEVTDLQSDEAVLVKVLEVFLSTLDCEAGALLDEKYVLQVFKCCFRIGRETRPTELLRRFAENTLIKLTQITFKRVLKGDYSTMDSIFEFLCKLCDPEKDGKSAALRLLGLTLVNTALEIVGSKISEFKEILNFSTNILSRALLRNSMTSNILVFNQTLRTMFNLIFCAAPYMHEQIESFIISLLKIAESKNSSNEHQEIVLEYFQEISRDSYFPVYLYQYFDCNENSFNIFENLCKFLSKNAFPVKEGEPLNIRHTLSLQCLLNIMYGISERSKQENKMSQEEQLQFYKIKESKTKYLMASELFNGKYKSGIEYLSSSKLVSSPPKPSEITSFMKKYSKWISKSSISDILKADTPILEAYMNSFDFKNMGIETALRYMIFSFHLTGEGQQIERITRFFAKKYFDDNKETQNLFEDDEAAWVYACAVLMLNSDLHNPSNVNKMSLEQWISNTESSVNIHTKKLIPKDELERAYNEMLIRKFEFETTHKDDFKENSLWENVLERSENFIKKYPHIYDENSLYHLDSYMFQQIYGKFISAITVVFETTEDFENIENLKTGFVDCSKIAAQYKLSDVFDNLVISLCKFTNSLSSHSENAVSQFGQNKKAQVASQTVFSITRNYGDNLREGWKNILDLILRMNELKLLPKNVLLTESFAEEAKYYTKVVEEKKQRKNSNSFSGNFSLFGFFGGSSAEDEVQTKLAEDKAKTCIERCHIPDLLKDAKLLREPSLEYLIKALIFKSSSKSEHDNLSQMFCLDLLTDITITNKDRAILIWNYIHDHLKNLIKTHILTEYEKSKSTFTLGQDQLVLLEHVIISIFRLCIRLMFIESLESNLYQVLLLLQQIPHQILKHFRPQTILGTNVFISTCNTMIKNEQVWELIFSILVQGMSSKDSKQKSIETIKEIFTSPSFKFPENVQSSVKLLLTYESTNSIEYLRNLNERLVSNFDSSEIWKLSFVSIINAFVKFSYHPEVEIRHFSLLHLTRFCLDSKILELPTDWIIQCFNSQTIMLEELLKIESKDFVETKLRCLNLFSKFFLNILNHISGDNDFEKLWKSILKFMKASSKFEYLVEPVFELMKNILLVMNAQEIWKEKQDLWELTNKELESFLPGIIKEISSEQNIENKK
eukprot:gene8225-50_t